MNDLLCFSIHGSSADDVEDGAQALLEMTNDKNLVRFKAEVATLDSEMGKVRDLLKKLEQISAEINMATSAQTIKSLRERMDGSVAQVLHRAMLIKSKLEALEKANLESRQMPGCEEGTPTDRMRSTVTNKQRASLKALMESFDRLRQTLQREYKETISRSYYAITGEKPSEEMVDGMIETGESERLLQKAVQEQGRRGLILETIEEMQERHDAVKEIEKNLGELQRMFMDMAVLVDAQGPQLITIQDAVDGARIHVESGIKRLTSAKRLHCCCCCCC